MEAAIVIDKLSKSYSGFSLKDISMTLPSGSVLGLVGENGAGKSTTLKLIMNTIRRDSGSVQVLGVDNKSNAFSNVKEDIGVVLDEAYFPEVITPKNVNEIMKYTYRNWDTACFKSYLDRFDLPKNKRFKDFSRGMKMKLAIAVALSHQPKLLLLDEATSGLDPIVRDEIIDIFNDFTREEDHSILISSHIVSDLEKICDYVAFLHKGKLLFCEEKDRILESYAVLKLTQQELEAIPPEAICAKKDGKFGVELLVKRAMISSAFPTEHSTLEDVILLLAKEERT